MNDNFPCDCRPFCVLFFGFGEAIQYALLQYASFDRIGTFTLIENNRKQRIIIMSELVSVRCGAAVYNFVCLYVLLLYNRNILPSNANVEYNSGECDAAIYACA